MKNIHIVPDIQHLARHAADTIVALSQQTLKSKGRFSLALSGGSTPKTLFELLAAEYSSVIDWKHTDIFWSDERVVPPNDSDSNYRLAYDSFLKLVPLPPDHIYRILGELSPDEAALAYDQTLTDYFHHTVPRFDLILLGMGDDGHTASLFPGTAALSEKSRWVVQNYVAAKPAWRITLTLQVLNNARDVIFLINGSSKSQRLKQVLQGTYDADHLPAQLIAPSAGNLTFIVDKEAASLL